MHDTFEESFAASYVVSYFDLNENWSSLGKWKESKKQEQPSHDMTAQQRRFVSMPAGWLIHPFLSSMVHSRKRRLHERATSDWISEDSDGSHAVSAQPCQGSTSRIVERRLAKWQQIIYRSVGRFRKASSVGRVDRLYLDPGRS